MQTNEATIIEFLKNNPDSTKAVIAEATNIKGLQLYQSLKRMVNSGEIISEGEGDDITYSLASVVEETTDEDIEVEAAENEATEDVVEEEQTDDEVTEETPEADSKVDEEEIGNQKEEPAKPAAKKKAGRDTSVFQFNGQSYNKGKLVHAIIAKHIADNPDMDHKQLKEIFPDDLLKRFGIFQDIETARSISGKYDRYFFKEEFVIKLKDKDIVICNQWTLDNIQPFLSKARELGHIIE